MKAIVFGNRGSAGSYLCELLESKGYEVVKPYNMSYSVPRDVDEVYNLAARTGPNDSWKEPDSYWDVNATEVLYLLEHVRKIAPRAKFFQAGSFDSFDPDTPYGVSKLAAQNLVRIYRERYNLFACTGIFCNMESPRRKKSVFSQRVVHDALFKRDEPIRITYANGLRDWGWAPEMVEAMWLMLQQSEPKDYVVRTHALFTILDFVQEALRLAGRDPMDYVIENCGREEHFEKRWDRAADFPHLSQTGWQATVRFHDVVRMLIEAAKQNG